MNTINLLGKNIIVEQAKENIDMSESLERVRLRELEAEEKWVFHGSGSKLVVLEPRQAYTYPSNSGEGKIPDDKPAVFASPNADVAIFMAIVNQRNAPMGSRSGFTTDKNGEFEFRATQSTMDQIHKAKGYVYVFDRNKFTERSSGEALSHEVVNPAEVIEVTEKDLPKNIEIKNF